MKKAIYLIGLFIAAIATAACSDWTEVETKNIDKVFAEADSALKHAHDAYLVNLRAYKESDHQVTFGWFGGWVAEGPKSRYLSSLPDSVDFVSIWGGWSNLNEAKLQDLRQVQTEKGIRALPCVLLMAIGDGITPDTPEGKGWLEWKHEFWGWKDGDEESIRAAVVKYANAICDTIDKYGYDGFDLDAEPSYAQPFETNKEMWKNNRHELFIETMAKRIGPTAETAEGRKKLLVVDGEPDYFSAELGKSFNYFILQAYSTTGNRTLDSRYQTQYNHFKSVLSPEEVAAKIIVCENFEAYSSTGGVNFYTSDGRTIPSYYGMAEWQPAGGRKGGIGSYHMEKDYAQTPNYKYIRKAIQMMNPAIK